MFQHLTVQDTVILLPSELENVLDSVTDRLKVRYQGKTIPDEGQCLVVKHIQIEDMVVIQGEGSLQVSVVFECIVMKPLPGAILVCKIKSQSESGLLVTCCTQDIQVPAHHLMHKSVWSGSQWFWQTPTKDQLPYITDEEIKLRVSIVDRSTRTNFIEGICNEEGLGMIRWGWNLK